MFFKDNITEDVVPEKLIKILCNSAIMLGNDINIEQFNEEHDSVILFSPELKILKIRIIPKNKYNEKISDAVKMLEKACKMSFDNFNVGFTYECELQ